MGACFNLNQKRARIVSELWGRGFEIVESERIEVVRVYAFRFS